MGRTQLLRLAVAPAAISTCGRAMLPLRVPPSSVDLDPSGREIHSKVDYLTAYKNIGFGFLPLFFSGIFIVLQ